MSATSAAIALWLGRSRLSSGSSSSSSRGRDARACAMSSALLLAAGQLADRAVRVRPRADQVDHLARPGRAAARPAPTTASPRAAGRPSGCRPGRAARRRPPRTRRCRVEAAPLRQVADPVAGLAGGRAEHGHGAGRERDEPEQRLDQRGLADAVRVRAPRRTPRRAPSGRRPTTRFVRPTRTAASRHLAPTGRAPRSRRLAHRPVALASASRRAVSWPVCQSCQVPSGGHHGLGDRGDRDAGRTWPRRPAAARPGSRSGCCRRRP